MFVRASVGSVLLFLTAACAGRSTVATRPMSPEDGPKATIRATMSGPVVYRQLDASFRLDEPGYAVVGHLGGDGMMRVLYPSHPEDVERVPSRKWIHTDAFDAPYDFAPQRYTFTTEPVRAANAMLDSYDGRGHGYIFVIASRRPMNIQALMDGLEFGELDVRDYHSMLDPRVAVRRVADAIAGAGNYTLRFAHSYSTYNYASFGSLGCQTAFTSRRARYYDPLYFGLYDDLQLTPLFWSGGSWGMPSWYAMSWRSPMDGGCGYSLAYHRFLFSSMTNQRYAWNSPIGVGGVGTGKPVTPVITRLRPLPNGSGGAPRRGRSSIDRHAIVTRQRTTNEIEAILNALDRLRRPDHRTFTGVANEPLVRTHASAFDRPGPRRALDESGFRPNPYGFHPNGRATYGHGDVFDLNRDRPMVSSGSAGSSTPGQATTTSSGSTGTTSTSARGTVSVSTDPTTATSRGRP